MTGGIFLLLGSNMGDQVRQLTLARRRLAATDIQMIRTSAIYRSAAWGPVKQDDFANQVLEVHFAGGGEDLLDLLLKTEEHMGRIRQKKWGPRIIDIDLLYYNQEIYESPVLKIPHPHLHHRRFTLLPLIEIAPAFIHPGFLLSQTALLARCPDTLDVTPWY